MDGGKDHIKPAADVTVPVKKLSYTGYLKNKYTKVKELNVADQVKSLLGGVEKTDVEVDSIPDDADTSITHKLTQKDFNMTKEITNPVTEPSLANDPVPLGMSDSTKASISTPSSDQTEFESLQQKRETVADQVKGLLEGAEKIDAEVDNVPNDVDVDKSIRHKLTKKAFNMTKEITNLITKPSVTNDPVPLGIADSTKASTSTPSSDQTELQSGQHEKLNVADKVRDSLGGAEKIDAEVENVPNDVDVDRSIRQKLKKKALNMTKDITNLVTQQSLTNDPVPLGITDSTKASTSTPSSDQIEVQSRQQIFTKALNALEPDHKSKMIALCGEQGVGKSKMMQKLKKVVKKRKMFHYIVDVVLGENTKPIAIQDAVAHNLKLKLEENTISARGYQLRKWFEDHSGGGSTKILIILNDVWDYIDLEEIGLIPLPHQGVINYKFLLSSRNRDVCIEMGVKECSILNLNDTAERSFFRNVLKISGDIDPEFSTTLGEEIVKKCSGLRIAMKSRTWTLINKSKDALSSSEYYEIGKLVVQVFKVSFRIIKDEESRAIFLLCALFPQESDIPTEDLVRYGWGLKIFGEIQTIREARTSLDKCIKRLMRTNLVIQSHAIGCVTLQGLALEFVFNIFSKVEHATNSIIIRSMLEWINTMSETCKRIIYSSRYFSQFPGVLKFPTISILKIMNIDKSIMFTEDFHGDMKNLEVISYNRMKHAMLPSSLQCSTVRVLHLHHCPSKPDWSAIGNLLNLEVLSLANSAIDFLPSEVGNLKKLMLLDLTNCVGLRLDNGVLRNLVKLEELYMRVEEPDSFSETIDDRKAISFINENYNEMAECSTKFSAFEFEFFQNNAEPKNMSFKNLEQFKISVGRSLKGAFGKSKHSFENTLMLVTNKSELLESEMNKLFVKTEVLYLSVDDINDLGDIEVKPLLSPLFSSFCNVRVIVISECTELRYLFSVGVANALRNLEHLEVYLCDNMEELVNNKSGGETITLPNLKFLSLISLPNLLGLCLDVSIIKLSKLVELQLCDLPNFISIYPANDPETPCFMKEKVMIPKLEKIQIRHLENLKEIWPCEFSTSEEVNSSLLREIEVTDCDNLVNLFPCNPMPLLHHIEHLEIRKCGSIEMLFNIDLNRVGKSKRESSSSLRSIEVYQLGKLEELWRVKGADNSRFLIPGFQAIENIKVTKCKRFRNVCTPSTAHVDMGARFEICINYYGESGRNNGLVDSSKEQEISVISNEETSKVGDNISNVVFPSYRVHSLCNLYKLKLLNSEGVEVVFEIEGPGSRESVRTQHNQGGLLPYLEELDIRRMDNMSHVWKCNWKNFLKNQKHQSEFPFHKLTTIHMSACRSIKYLFSPLMAKLLSNLTNIKIELCDDIEEVVSSRDDEDGDGDEKKRSRRNTLFPRLAFLTLDYLRNLKRIGGGGAQSRATVLNTTGSTAFLFDQSKADGVSWSLCQYSREIRIVDCNALSSVVPYYAAGEMQNLRVLKIESCMSVKEVFERHGPTATIPGTKNVIMLQLPSLKILEIKDCGLLEHIFTYAVVESLMQLEELTVKNCKAMKVIVNQEPEEETVASKVVVFRRLKSIALVNLPNLVGFFSGMNNNFRWPSSDKYSWPSLKNFTVIDCPKTVAFVPGGSMAQKLKDKPTTNLKEVKTPIQREDSTSSSPSAPNIPMSFHNQTEVDVDNNDSLKYIIPAGELLQLKTLEKISVWSCNQVEQVFEAVEGTHSEFDESQTVVKLQSLKKVDLGSLCRLKYIWKSNPRIVYDFPNLTKVNISRCEELKHVFTSSMVGSLLQLQELNVSRCEQMDVIIKNENALVEEENIDGKVNEIMLPCLKSMKLEKLQKIKGFCLGKEDFSLPSLVTLSIEKCPALMIFTNGNLATPELNEIETSSGQRHAGDDINSFISNNLKKFN